MYKLGVYFAQIWPIFGQSYVIKKKREDYRLQYPVMLFLSVDIGKKKQWGSR